MSRFRVWAVFSVALLVCLLCGAVRKFQDRRTIRKEERSSQEPKDTKIYMSYDDWVTGSFRSRKVSPRWFNGDQYSSKESDNSIVLVSKDGTNTTLLAGSAWDSLTDPSSYSISADQQYVAITYGDTYGYAHYMTFYSVAVFRTSNSSQIVVTGEALENVQKIKWDPVGHKMAFVKNFNVYVTDLVSAADQVTDDGEENMIFNGITDYLYYTEITDDDALLWWSPDATYLAYATIDQRNGVENFEFARFDGGNYPNMISFPYPKPGTPIPKIKIYLFDTVLNVEAVELVPSTTVTNWGDYYLNSAIWRHDIFTPTWKNRLENEAMVESCQNDTTGWTCDHVSEMESVSDSGWLGMYKSATLMAMPLSNEYLTVMSDDTGFLHLVLVDTDANTRNWRTSGNFEVVDTWLGDDAIYFYDSTNDWVYYTSTEDPSKTDGSGLPRIRHLWRVKAHGENTGRECITCGLNDAGDTMNRCNWVSPSFSPGGSVVIVNCGGTANHAPISTRHEIDDSGIVGDGIVVENNDDLLTNLEAFHFRTSEFGEITLPDFADEIFYYTLHKPPNFDATKSYPMLVAVYSGPATQYTTDSFYADWARGYIASSDLDVIVVTFDGRGTGFRGDNIRHQVYRQFGKYEPIDQIEAAKQISEMHDYIDNERIAIWGESYGGYATSRTIGEDENSIFKCGFSVAPVTDWLTYLTIYTERYMRLPDESDNKVGYNESTAIQKFENYGKHYFALIHGTGDENVHFLNSARLSKALIEADVDFSAYFAADETHSFNRYPNGYAHHYKLLTNHLKRCFNL